jgi:hypothetical protein
MRFLVVSAAVLLLLPTAGRADEITDQLDQARQYYDSGDLQQAVTELGFATEAIRGKLAGQLGATFPPAPSGWTAADAEQQAGMPFFGGGTTLSRTYKAAEGGATIEATLAVDNPMLQGFAALISNPAMLASQPNAKRVRIGRDNALLTWDAAEKSGDITLMRGGRVLAKLEGHSLGSADILTTMMQGWPLDQVEKLVGN